MSRSQVTRWILGIEVVGFGIVALAIWVDEFFDLPHRLFGTPPATANYHEAAFEIFFVLGLGIIVAIISLGLLRRIARLESLLPICSFCKRIRRPDANPEKQESWQPIELYINDRTGAQFSHGLCPACLKEHYGQELDL